MKTLRDLFLEELKDMYDAEHRIIKALPKLAEAATCEKLKAAFLGHLQETSHSILHFSEDSPCLIPSFNRFQFTKPGVVTFFRYLRQFVL